MKLQHLVLTALVPAALCIPANAAYITIYDSLFGGSGDVDNVLFHPTLQMGTIIDAALNTSGKSFAAEFESTTPLTTGGGGQADLEAADGTTFTDLCFRLLNDFTFTKLILNPDASANGNIEFTVTYLMPDEGVATDSFSLKGSGQNFFTVIAGDGALISEVCWTSDVGINNANQYRVGGLTDAEGNRVPDGGTTLAALGLSLIGLGSMRRFLISKA